MSQEYRHETVKLTRRELLRAAGAAGAAGAVAGAGAFLPGKAFAASVPPSLNGPQEGGRYRFAVGRIEAMVVSDGTFRMQPIQPMWAPEAAGDALDSALRSAFLPTDRVDLDANVLLVKSGGELILADAGAGSLMGPLLGKLRERMEAAGIRPGDVAGVVLSHAHGDHFGGLLDEAGKPVFPDAKVYLSRTEVDFWTAPNPDLSKVRMPKEQLAPYIASIRKHLSALEGRLVPVAPGKRIAEGVEIVEASGHTPGHIALSAASGKESLLNIGDAAHHFLLSLARPEWTSVFDVDPEAVTKTRRRLFRKAADERTRVLGYHFPFPGIGHVRTAKDGGFDWVPEPWNWTPATG